MDLTRKHELSNVKSKVYGEEEGRPYTVYYFYIEMNNGIWSNSRLLKIGSTDENTITNLIYPALKRARL